MKIYYDQKHTPPRFKVGQKAFIRLSKKSDEGYYLQNQTKLSLEKIGPFLITERSGPLAFRLELPDCLKGIHLVISVEHLEPAPDSGPYERAEPKPGPIHVEGQERYIIEKISGREMRKVPGQRKRQQSYQVK